MLQVFWARGSNILIFNFSNNIESPNTNPTWDSIVHFTCFLHAKSSWHQVLSWQCSWQNTATIVETQARRACRQQEQQDSQDQPIAQVNEVVGQEGRGVQNQGQVLPIKAQVNMQAAAAAPPPPPFVLGLVRDNNILHFATPAACKTYYKAITPLEVKLDGTLEGFIVIMDGI